MTSTRIWLADALNRNRISSASGMALWLVADDTLVEMRVCGIRVVRQRCSRLMRELIAWLHSGREEPTLAAAGVLRGSRALYMGRAFLMEFLRVEGLLESISRRGRAEVSVLLDRFFGLAHHAPDNGQTAARAT